MEDTNLINISAEKNVLACIMLDNTLLAGIDVDIEDFYREAHKDIYQAMRIIFARHEIVDLITVQQQLRDTNKLDAVGGLEYIMGIFHSAFTTTGFESHCKIVKECSLKRLLLKYAKETEILAKTEDVNVGELVDELQRNINNIAVASSTAEDTLDIAGGISDAILTLRERAEKNEAGVPTSFADFDRVTGGLHKSDLIILAARPAMGKTAFAMNIARNVAYRSAKNVMLVSLEMNAEQLQHRLISSLSGVELTKFRSPASLTQDEWRLIDRARAYKPQGRLIVYDKVNASPAEITRKARQIQVMQGLDLIIIDYLQLMHGSNDAGGNRAQEISEISRAVKNMARELNVPVIALSQLNRGVEARTDKRPMLSDLRESGSIEQDADLVMFLYRDAYYNPDSADTHTELIIAKHRHGATTTVPLYFEAKTTTFKNLARRA